MSINVSEEQVRSFRDNGYLVIRGLASGEEIRAMRRVAEAGLEGAVAPFELEADVAYPGAPAAADAPVETAGPGHQGQGSVDLAERHEPGPEPEIVGQRSRAAAFQRDDIEKSGHGASGSCTPQGRAAIIASSAAASTAGEGAGHV